MDLENTELTPIANTYGVTAIFFHWVLALGLVGLFGMGFFMSDLPVSPLRLKLFNWHKWAGICVLVLSLWRLAWRMSHQAPPLPEEIQADMPAWQQQAHYAVQYFMYALFLIVPLVGWAYSSAAGFPVVVFGVLPLPDFVAPDKAWAAWIKPWHEITAFGLAGLVILHVSAALKHQWMDKHALLQRMWPPRQPLSGEKI